jgi:hypothetical protein
VPPMRSAPSAAGLGGLLDKVGPIRFSAAALSGREC